MCRPKLKASKRANRLLNSSIFLFLECVYRHEAQDRLRVHITDAEKQRWEVPYDLLPREQPPKLKQTIGKSRKSSITASEYSGPELIFSYTKDPFGFAVKRKSNGQTLFNSSSDASDPFGNLVFKDQYLEISTNLPEDASLYGLGENSQPHGIKLYPNDPYTLYTTDVSAINLNTDLYGSHPVYMDLRNDGGRPYAHAVLLLNSNGMDVFYRGTSLTYKVIGGVFDFYFFAGPTPLSVVDQYTSFVGRPAPMPYWSLGTIKFSPFSIPYFLVHLWIIHTVRINIMDILVRGSPYANQRRQVVLLDCDLWHCFESVVPCFYRFVISLIN